MAFDPVQLKVGRITADSVWIHDGPNGYEIPRADLERRMREGASVATLLDNLAANLALAGVDPRNDAALKARIESQTFRR